MSAEGTWDCGHPLYHHTRGEAAVCRDRQRAAFVAQHTSGGASAPSPPVEYNAEAICITAAGLVGGPRAATHGDKSLNFANTAALWNAIIEAKARQAGWPSVDVLPRLDALDVANMLEAFKIARRYSGSHNLDDYIDGAGYAGCAGEIAEKEHPANAPLPTSQPSPSDSAFLSRLSSVVEVD